MARPGDETAASEGGRTYMRASHADREQVIGMLKTAFVQGRLAKDEFDLRVGRVLASRTYADLNALTADIPAGLVRAQSPNPARKPASVPPPKAVRNAARLMCAGAVLTVGVSATALATLGGVRSAAAYDLGAGQWPTVMLTQAGFWLASAPIGAAVWLWLAWATRRGYHWARPAFAAFFGVLSILLFFGLGQGGGPDALQYTWPDLIVATAPWLAGLAAGTLICSQAAGPHYRRRAAKRAAIPANGTGR